MQTYSELVELAGICPGLVTVRREGRSMIYTAQFSTMNALLGYLTENCCQGRHEQCMPMKSKSSRPSEMRRKESVP